MSPLYDKVYNYLNNKVTILEDITSKANSSGRRNNKVKIFLYDLYKTLESRTIYIYDNKNKKFLCEDLKSWIDVDKLTTKKNILDVASFDGMSEEAITVMDILDPNHNLKVYDTYKIFRNDFDNSAAEELTNERKDLKDQLEKLQEKLTKLEENLDVFTDDTNKIKQDIVKLVSDLFNNRIVQKYKLISKVKDYNNNLFTNLNDTETISNFLELLTTVVKELIKDIKTNYTDAVDKNKEHKRELENFYKNVFEKTNNEITKLARELDNIYKTSFNDPDLLSTYDKAEEVEAKIEEITSELKDIKVEKEKSKTIPSDKQYVFVNSLIEYAIVSKNNGVQYSSSMYLNPAKTVEKIKPLLEVDELYQFILIDSVGRSYEVPVIKIENAEKRDNYNNLKQQAIKDLDGKSALDMFLLQHDYENELEAPTDTYNNIDNKDNIVYKYDFSNIPDDTLINEIYVNTSLNRAENDYFAKTSLSYYKLNSIGDEFLLPSLYNNISNLNKFINNDHNIDNLLEKFTALYSLYLCQDPKAHPVQKDGHIDGKFMNVKIPGYTLTNTEKTLEYLNKLTNKQVTQQEVSFLLKNFTELCDEFNDITFESSNKVMYTNSNTKTKIKNITSVNMLINVYLNDIKYGFLEGNYVNKFMIDIQNNNGLFESLYSYCDNSIELLQPLYDLLFSSTLYTVLTNVEGELKQNLISTYITLFAKNTENDKDIFNNIFNLYLINESIESAKQHYEDLKRLNKNTAFHSHIDSVIKYLSQLKQNINQNSKYGQFVQTYYANTKAIMEKVDNLINDLQSIPRVHDKMKDILNIMDNTIVKNIKTIIIDNVDKYQKRTSKVN